MAAEVLSAIKSHVGSVVEMLRGEIAEQIKALPTPKDGKDGLNGKDGADGRDGKDAPPVDVEAITQEVVKRIPAPTNGVDGKNGIDGKDGINGEKGEPGIAGKDGKDGADGKDGRNGEDGKDALDIEPITNLEKGRSYSRGTWATYKGSLIRAMRTTDAIKDGHPADCGWAVMVEGNSFEDMTVEHDGKRGVIVKWLKGGREETKTIKFPVVLDAGFYKDGMSIEAGDGVTFGGSYWIAQKDTNTKPELGNPDWRLAVKKGRDGKRD